MTFEPIWNWAIAAYLFLAGLGGGAYITAAFMRRFCPGTQKMQKAARLIAFVVVAVGLVLLMFDARAGLFHPLRFALLLANPGSVMTWGVVFLSVFEIMVFIQVICDFRKKELPRWFDLVCSVFALCVCVYTGCLLGVVKSFPLWNNALLPILFLVSALSTGIASVLLAGALKFPEEFKSTGLVKKIHYGMPVVEIVLIASLCFITASVGDAGTSSVGALLCGKYAVAFWLGLIAIGLVVPAAIETKLLFFSDAQFEDSAKGQRLSAAADTGVIIGGFVLRILIIYAALPLTMVVPYL